MRFLYSLGIRLYGFLIWCSSFFNEKARKWIRGRKDWAHKIENSGVKNGIWIHCASLGEFEQGRPIIESLKKRFPKEKIVLSFFSPSGYEVRKNYHSADLVTYLPLDTQRNARKLVSLLKPKAAIFIKYEVWHNLFAELNSEGVNHYIASAIFRENQVYFKPYGTWFKNTLTKVNMIFAQDEETVKILNSNGVKNNLVTGDTRFDRVWEIANNKKELPRASDFSKQNLTIVAGSTWPEDENYLNNLLAENPEVKIIIAPHEVGKDRVNSILKNFTLAQLWSEQNIKPETRVLIIDEIGILSSLYQYSDLAYIGGGFGVGIHNILEAACFGKPIVFGPRYEKFKEACDLTERKGAFSFSNKTEFKETAEKLLSDENFRLKAGQVCLEYVSKNKGATKRILESLSSLL